MLDEDLNNGKRRRVARACDSCRRKKVRCDGVQPASDPPSCTNCKIYGQECSFIDAPKKRGPPKGYVDALETRLQRIESVINGLVQSGRLHESTVRSALSQASESSRGLQKSPLPAPDAQPVSKSLSSSDVQLTSLENSPYASSSEEEFTSDSNGSQSDVNEYDQLATDERGNMKYIGKSSGAYVFTKKIVSRHIIVCDDLKPPKRLADKRILSELPSRKLCDQMLDMYWKKYSFHPPLIDKQDFMEKYNNMDASYDHIILLYAILSTVSMMVDDNADISSASGINFYSRTYELLKEEFDYSTLSIIQALLLLSWHHKERLNSQTWIFTGLAIRLAQDMGLHRESLNENFNEREAEVRRRVWWTCVTFDSFLSIALGRPLAINEEDHDVRYPEPGKLLNDLPDSVELFIQYIKVSLTISQISRRVYGANSKRTESTLVRLDAELNKWHDNIPPRFLYDRQKKVSEDASCIMALFINLIYHTIQIILHRPYIRCPKSRTPPSSIPSLTICTVAASNITHIMYRVMKERTGTFNYKWKFMEFTFFTAVTMHIINALSDDERFREVAKQGLRMSIKCVEFMKPDAKRAARFLQILNNLLKIKNGNFDKMNQKPSTGASNDEMNYEFIYSSGSTPFVPSMQFDESSEFNELFSPPNTNAFIPEISSLLFENVNNNYNLSIPHTVDWAEWSNWTEYIMKLQASKNNQ
ncbi:16605_t:CDS:2 [Acaulospora morrowiae]|uniref:16605_t:CDS:1 n=1 Tax=Acaulospora morrowiae TaxID=94023 RepID=A0A9N9BS33_9GLOM|nr:16605_t:CDS:2 [Acaulospora morrowiae]